MNLWQSIVVAFLGSAGSFLLVGVLSLAGKRGGAPQLTLSRAAFGTRGNIGPNLASWISMLGWEVIIVVTSAYALLGLLAIAGLPSNTFWTVVSLAFIAALAIAISLLGHATLVWIQRAPTWIFGALTIVVIVFLVTKTNWGTVASTKAGPWDSGVLAGLTIIAAGTGISWANAADYSRYLPTRDRGSRVVLWTTAGATIPVFVLIMVGVPLSSRVSNLSSASNPITAIQHALPSWMAIPYLLTAIGGLIAEADLNIYSSGLNLLALGVKVQRYKTVLIDGAVTIAGGIFIMIVRQDFFGSFESFLLVLADGLVAWAAVFLIDMILRRGYDESSLVNTSPRSGYFYRGGVHWTAVVARLLGIVIGLAFTTSPWFKGPLAIGLFASSSLGSFIAFGVSAVSYWLLTRYSGSRGGSTIESSAEISAGSNIAT